jgi:hypothetical protein
LDVEIDPPPDDAERRAILAALDVDGEPPPGYRSAWREAALREAAEVGDTDGRAPHPFVPNHSN